MQVITIEKKKYSLADDIIKAVPIWCKGVRNGRELIKKKLIEEKYFIYARLTNEEWIPNDGKSVKYDKVLVRNICLSKIDAYVKELKGDDDVVDDNNISKAPPIIDLEDHEKFSDDNGNVLEIETRGIKQVDQIYFKVKDVSVGFDVKHLYTTVIGKLKNYLINVDYKYFMCDVLFNKQNKLHKNKVSKELFLTYKG